MTKTIWIDIDNPPQVQYLLPFKKEFENRGFNVVVTARNYGITPELLKNQKIPYKLIGKASNGKKIDKIFNNLSRSLSLYRQFMNKKPLAILTGARASAMTSYFMQIPSFAIADYEFVELKSYKYFGTYIFYPNVIDSKIFKNIGFTVNRLIPFNGIKEDITFSSIDLNQISPYQFQEINVNRFVLVLLRPPSEVSHYYKRKSKTIFYALLDYLTKQPNVIVIYSPRDEQQINYIRQENWINQPVILNKGIHFISLMKSIDLVISSGGTMLREAAYLGIPAYSIFQSKIGAVDNYLASQGKLTIINDVDNFPKIEFVKKRNFHCPNNNGKAVLKTITDIIIEKISHNLKLVNKNQGFVLQ